MIIGGFSPLTTIDYPGELAAVVFCQGCPWRCGYCQNVHLLPRRPVESVSWEGILEFLARRRGLLDGVVFSGGEPTLQKGLPEAVREIRALGFKVGLHSAGPYPDRLSRVLPSLDWVGLDIKAPAAAYDRLTGVPGSGAKAWESARRVVASGIDYEIRTTVHPDLLPPVALQELVRDLRAIGARRYRLQTCVLDHCQEPGLRIARRTADFASAPAEIGAGFEDFAVRT